MPHIETVLQELQRPRLLIAAARYGARKYRRSRHLRSLLASTVGMDQRAIVKYLLEKESDMDWDRRSRSADYNVKRHILALSAIVEEVRVLRQSDTDAHHANASGSEAFFSLTKFLSASSAPGSIAGF